MRVLLLEDNTDLGFLLKQMFQEHGHLVHWVSNGRDGLDQVVGRQFDLIITDLNMPIQNGFEFAQKCREKGVKTTIILHSSEPVTLDEAKAHGIDAVVGKCDLTGLSKFLQSPKTR